MMEWQPIETAPKNGTVILVCGGNAGFYYPTTLAALWDNGEWLPDQWEQVDESLEPEYWMPLPEPPQCK